MFKSLLLITCLLALCYYTAGQEETIDISQLSQEELQLLQQQGAITGSLPTQSVFGGATSGAAGSTFYDRLMTVIQPIRTFNLRETVTGFFRRITTFLFPVQTVQATARDGTMTLKPEIEMIIDNLVDRLFYYGKSYFGEQQ